MPVIVPIPKSAFIVTIAGMETIWTTFSGIVDTAESGQYANGTGRRIYKVVGPRALDDVTLSAPYDPAFAHTIEQIWSDYNCEFITITIQPTTCNGDASRLIPLNSAQPEASIRQANTTTARIPIRATRWLAVTAPVIPARP